jgi:hypothetical protein
MICHYNNGNLILIKTSFSTLVVYNLCCYGGIDYILTQQAYAENNDRCNDGICYRAQAKMADQWDDDSADTYIVTWDTIEGFLTSGDDDESNACDWSKPLSVVKS